MAKMFFTNESLETFVNEIKTHVNSEVSTKSDIGHAHEIANVSNLQTTLDSKAEVDHSHSDYSLLSHSHSDTYYSKDEINAKLDNKADSSHVHTGVYDVNGAAADALILAQEYTDSKIDALVGEGASTTLDTIGEISSAIVDNQDAIDLLNSAIANKANVADLNYHANDTEIHITDAERTTWNAKSDFSGNYNDLTNKPNIPSIDGLASEDYVDEKVDAITVESIGALPNTTVIPTVPTNVSAFANDAGYLTEHQSLDGLATETYVNTQIDAIDIPSALSDLTTDSTHRVVTDTEKAAWNAKSDFSGSYNDLTNKPSIPSISGLATETYVDEAVSVKADSSHTHSISNVSGLQSALDAKSATTHNHDASYDTKGAANSALNSAKAYADELIADEVANRDSAIATAKSSAISTASSDATTKADNALASAKTYADNAVATAKNDLLNGAGTAYDTLKELGDLIDNNVDAIEALEAVAAGKANAIHTHTISDIANLQTTLDGKAATSHGAHVSYSTTAPVMDGTASVGTASTVARSDHKHPTDTSRASQTDLDALETVVAGKANSSHTHTIANVTNLQATLDGKAASSHTHKVANISDLTATATELNYMDGVTSNVQTQLDGKAASSHNHSASNITSGTLSSDRLPTVPVAKGGTGATTAAGALTNLGITATATELNYVDGVTSNIQTQLNGKASSSHTHNYAGSSSAGGDANNALKLQGYTRSNLYADMSAWIQAVGLTHTITVDGNKDTYYPVRIYLSSSKTMPTYVSIHKNLGTTTPSIDGNHSNGTSSMWLIYEGRNRSWDGNGGYLKTWYRYMGYANLCSHTDIGTGIVGDLIVWLRGGGCVYNVSVTNSSAAPSIYYEETNIGTETYPYNVAPRTDLGNQGIYRSVLGYGNIDGNATTATNVAWSGVTSKPSYYDAKAIKSITRSGTTFTYTCMDGTTGTFTQQDNNTTYSTATTSANGLMSASDKSKLDGMVLATVSEVETYLGI